MNLHLESNERLDEVNDKLKLIQKKDGLTFGTDALLLAAFVNTASPRANRALELGGGSGIVSMLLGARGRFSHSDCLEVQEEYVRLTERNLALNSLEDRVCAVLGDVRSFPEKTAYGSYDVVFSNPPYMLSGAGDACQSTAKEIARHEHFGGITDFALCASRALRYGGAFFVVYRPDRLTDLVCALREASLEPKRMCFVSATQHLAPSMVLLEARRGGKPGLWVTPPLILTENGHDSDPLTHILTQGSFPASYERRTPCQASNK